jgi:hypothetical protein
MESCSIIWDSVVGAVVTRGHFHAMVYCANSTLQYMHPEFAGCARLQPLEAQEHPVCVSDTSSSRFAHTVSALPHTPPCFVAALQVACVQGQEA